MKRLLACLMFLCLVSSVPFSEAQAPATTTISDTIYRADGTPAGGTLLISWPAFATASGKSVAAGQKSITIGAGGAVSVGLVPNEGATPSGTYYKVVYKLNDGSTSEELWSVPDVPTTTIAAVRSTIVPQGVAIQVASRQYVDTQINAVAGSRFHNIRFCDQFAGADAGAKITACIADLPSSGGTADARGFEGVQTWASDPFTAMGAKKVRLVLGGASTHSLNVNLTVPASLVIEFTGGSLLSIPNGITVTWNGGIEAHENEQVFSLAGTGKVQFASNRGVSRVSAKWWGAKGDGTPVDGPPLQAALDALPTAALITDGNLNANSSQSEVWLPAGDYVITAPLNITRNAICLVGAGEGTRLRNTTTDSDVLRINHGASIGLLFPCVKSLTLRGTGLGSRALYANAVRGLHISKVSTINHPGTTLYLESTNAVYSGCVFANIEDLQAEPATAVAAIYDKGGRNNVYRNVTARVSEIGMDFEDAIGNTIIGGYIESNINGTLKTGIRARSLLSGGAAGSVKTARYPLTIIGTYFENNTLYAIDADRSYYVALSGIRGSGGYDLTTLVAKDVFRLDGGGTIDGMWAGSVKVSSAAGIVRTRNAWGIYGDARQLHVEGAVFPIGPSGSNAAGKSWFDSDPTWTVAGASAPTVSYDATQSNGFYGANSKKASFPSSASSFTDSRYKMDGNSNLAVADGDMVSAIIASKFSVAGKAFGFRLRDNAGAGNVHDVQIITDTNWNIYTLQGKVNNGATLADLWGSAVNGNTLGVAVDNWVGAVALTKNAEPALINTEWAARGNYDVDFHTARFRTGRFHNSLVIGNGSGNAFLESVEESGNPPCAAGDFRIWASSTGNKWKKCEDGTISDLDTGGAGSGDNLSLNGAAATDADFDDATPAAPSDGVNVRWQKDAGTPNNISANLQFATTSQAGAVSAAAQSMAGEKAFLLADGGTTDKSALTVIADSQTSSGTRANLIGFESTAKQSAAGGVVTNAYGVMIRSALESAGTITNAYGLRIEPQTVGTAAGNFDVDSGPATSTFSTNLQDLYINVAAAAFKMKDPSSSKNTALNGTLQISNASGSEFGYGMYGAAESTHASGNLTQVNAFGGDAYHSGAGTVTDLQGGLAEAFALSGAGNITRATGLETFVQAYAGFANTITAMHGVRVRTNVRATGTITTNYGIKIEDQAGVGASNYSLFTGSGLVRLGDDLDFATDNADDIGASGTNRPRTVYSGTSLVTPTVNATTALQTNGTTRIDSTGAVNNVSLDAEGTGNSLTTVSKIFIDGAGCQNTSASSNWDLPTSAAPAAACRTGTNTQQATLDFATDSGLLTAQRKFRLPSDWAAGSNIEAIVTWNTSATTNDVVWQVAIACASDGDSDDPGFTDDAFTADTAKGAANQLNDTAMNTVTTTGSCAAGDIAFVRIKRDPANASDTLAAGTTARLIGVELTIRRTQ